MFELMQLTLVVCSVSLIEAIHKNGRPILNDCLICVRVSVQIRLLDLCVCPCVQFSVDC